MSFSAHSLALALPLAPALALGLVLALAWALALFLSPVPIPNPGASLTPSSGPIPSSGPDPSPSRRPVPPQDVHFFLTILITLNLDLLWATESLVPYFDPSTAGTWALSLLIFALHGLLIANFAHLFYKAPSPGPIPSPNPSPSPGRSPSPALSPGLCTGPGPNQEQRSADRGSC